MCFLVSECEPLDSRSCCSRPPMLFPIYQPRSSSIPHWLHSISLVFLARLLKVEMFWLWYDKAKGVGGLSKNLGQSSFPVIFTSLYLQLYRWPLVHGRFIQAAQPVCGLCLTAISHCSFRLRNLKMWPSEGGYCVRTPFRRKL